MVWTIYIKQIKTQVELLPSTQSEKCLRERKGFAAIADYSLLHRRAQHLVIFHFP
jgi:hypothetical protein